MTETISTKRRYVRLTDEEWAEVRSLWATGGVDLSSLSERYGVTPRAIQAHCAKHGVVRGSASAARAKAAEERILATAMPENGDDLAVKIRNAKAAALDDADAIRTLVRTQLQALAEPAAGLSAVAALRAIDIGASALERARRSRFAALGLDKGDPLVNVELPELIIRELTTEEVTAIRDQQLQEDAEQTRAGELDDFELAANDDDIISEGEDVELSPLNDDGRVGGNDA